MLEWPSEHPMYTFGNHKNKVTVVYINIYEDYL